MESCRIYLSSEMMSMVIRHFGSNFCGAHIYYEDLNKHNGFVIIDTGTHYSNEMIPIADDSKQSEICE